MLKQNSINRSRVVAVITMLAMIIALATPFTAIEAAAAEFTVPTGCTYTCANGTVYNAGSVIPADYEPQTGDTFVDADYTYKFIIEIGFCNITYVRKV